MGAGRASHGVALDREAAVRQRDLGASVALVGLELLAAVDRGPLGLEELVDPTAGLLTEGAGERHVLHRHDRALRPARCEAATSAPM